MEHAIIKIEFEEFEQNQWRGILKRRLQACHSCGNEQWKVTSVVERGLTTDGFTTKEHETDFFGFLVECLFTGEL